MGSQLVYKNMQGTEFLEIFKHFKHFKELYAGCFSSDNLPKSIKTNHFIVINTSPSNTEGAHWYCIYKPHQSKIEVFDSLGIDSTKKTFLINSVKFRGIKEVEWNKTIFQSSSSMSCGKYVLYFLFQRLYNQDVHFKDLLDEIFVNDIERNEQKVEKFYSDYLTLPKEF